MVPSRTCRPSPVISRAMARGCQTRRAGSRAAGSVASLVLEQPGLAVGAPAVAAEAAVGPQDPVAGHDHGHVVAGAGGPGGLGAQRVGGRVGQPGQAAELLVADGLPGRHRPQSRPGGLLGGVAGLGHGDVGERPGLALQIGEHPGGHGAGVGGRPETGRPPARVEAALQGLAPAGEPGRADPVASAGWAVPHLWNTARVGLVAAPEATTGRPRDRLGWPYRPTERFDNVTATEVPAKAGRREWIGLAVLALACLLYVMDLTVLHLAVPALSADLAPTSAQLLWIIDIYGFFVAGSLITMGTLGDRIGRRKLLMIGATAFGLVSLLGGAMLELFWWGSVFLLALPVMAALLILGPRVLPEYKDPEAGRLDVLSAGMSVIAVLAVIYGLKEIAQDGLGAGPVAAIVGGLAVGVAFVVRQRRLPDPMIDVGLFRLGRFNAALATNFLAIFVAVGYFLFVAQYLQLVVGLSPLGAGLWSLPSAVGFIVGSQLAPRLLHNVRPAYVISGGLFLAAVGLGLLAQAGVTDGLVVLVAGSVVTSLGMAPVFGLTTEMIVGSAPPEQAGAASGISETGSELGGALGIAAREAFVAGMRLSSAMAAGIGVALAILALLVLRHQEPMTLDGGEEPELATVTTSGDDGDDR